MSFRSGPASLAATGSTGNVTGAAYTAGDAYETAIFQFVVEAIGATPTVTFKFQGSLDGTNWYDLPYVTDASDTLSQAPKTVTAVGASVEYSLRPFEKFRVVTSANTNVTFRAELYLIS